MTRERRKKVQIQELGLSHSMAHYLLTIHRLKESKGYARVTDIARELSLTKGSVSTGLNNLKSKNYIIEEEGSKFVCLSEEGHKVVHGILSSRTLLFYFLRDFVGVSEKTAIRDACLMEHLISDETRERFFAYIKSSTNIDVKTPLDLVEFEDVVDFMEQQRDDGMLPTDRIDK